MGLLLGITVLCSGDLCARAGDPVLDAGIANGDYIPLGHIRFMDYNAYKDEATILWSTSLYTVRKNLETETEQELLDLDNTMEYVGGWNQAGWAPAIVDHVNSPYSGRCPVTGMDNFGCFELWNCVPRKTLIEARFEMPDGYILKYWACEKVDCSGFTPKADREPYLVGQVYWSDGTDLDDYGNREENIDKMITCYSCWPHDWGDNSPLNEGRILAAFREDHKLVWDVYVKDNGIVLYGDYNYAKNYFAKRGPKKIKRP